MRFRTFVSWFLTGLLLLPAQAWTQQTSETKANLVQETGTLKVVAIQGEGARNNIRTRTATAPVVEVRDESDKPVAGAEVVFQLPAAGPGGVFNGWMRTQTVRTDAEGRATATGMVPNEEEGRFNIKVTATAGKRSGTVIIAQINTRNGASGGGASKSHKTLWIVLGLAAAGGIIGGVAATHDGGSTTATTTAITITPGPVSVGGPR